MAHKANHVFWGSNAFYRAVEHPVLGGIGCLVALMEIDQDDEIYVDYNYDIDGDAPDWSMEAFNSMEIVQNI